MRRGVESASAQHSWSRGELTRDERWKIDATSVLEPDLLRLLAWAEERENPLGELKSTSLKLPSFDALAVQARRALGRDGVGAALIRGLPEDPEDARLAYLALGCRLGDPLENYGRLYEVRDLGGSYLDAPIPVSQTRHSTSFHTDSARKETLPRIVS
ncbi:MAG: hypothetical protein OSB14_02060, partial [Planctomycetota bacterium]|nr:hypothetical protein [Planctomycetota bacterium]